MSDYYNRLLEERRSRNAKKDQLCWTCKRAVPNRGCEWADKLKPVKGWYAIPTKIRMCEGKYTDSYKIISCPKYINDNDRKTAI